MAAKSKPVVKRGKPAVSKSRPALDVLEKDLLNTRRRLFIEYYLVEPNATQAAIKAGYSQVRADSTGSELLNDPIVRAELEARSKKLLDKLEITQERVLNETALLAFSDITEILTTSSGGVPAIKRVEDWSPMARKAISKVKVKRVDPKRTAEGVLIEEGYDILEFGLWDKTANLGRLFEHLKLAKGEDDPLDALSDSERLAKIAEILDRGRLRKAAHSAGHSPR